jgi:hypothetical protein
MKEVKLYLLKKAVLEEIEKILRIKKVKSDFDFGKHSLRK